MRLLSYNIHKGIGGADRRYRLERVIEVIESQNPDIICLQEVDQHVRRSRFHDQPHVLAERLNAVASLYQMNVHLKTGGYGNLVLSRWPFLSSHRISLTLGRKKARGAVLTVIDTPEGNLHVVASHLGLNASERRWQVRHLLTHRAFQESMHLPTFLVGDFNDWRNALDRVILNHQEFQQVTRPISRFRSFPAVRPVISLDKAFVRGEVYVQHAHVLRNPLTHRASDHLPVVVDFHLDANAPMQIASGNEGQ